MSKITKVAIRMIPIGLVASTILAGCVGTVGAAQGPSNALTLRAQILSEKADAAAAEQSNQAVIGALIRSEHQEASVSWTNPRLDRDEDAPSASSTRVRQSDFRGK